MSQGNKLADEIDAYCYMENSSLKNTGVMELFETAVRVAMLAESIKYTRVCCSTQQ